MTRNSTRNTKNTVEGGLACVVCEIWAKNGKNRKRRQGLVRHCFQKSMKLKIWNYIYQWTGNSTRNTKNTVQGGLACVVCEIWAKNGKNRKRRQGLVRHFFSKNRKRRQGLVRNCFQKSMKLKIWNYIYQWTRNSTRNTKNTVEGGLACVVCEIWAKNGKNRKRRQGLVRHFFSKNRKRRQGLVRHCLDRKSTRL